MQRIADPSIAGGGGKALAIAARYGCKVHAHDANFARMKDIPNRAERAGTAISVCSSDHPFEDGEFDCVLLDVPCSGSGSWRRAPDIKWQFSRENLDELTAVQKTILEDAHRLVAPNGTLAYATCSIFESENALQINAFLKRRPDWEMLASQSWPITDDGDGFFVAQLKRS